VKNHLPSARFAVNTTPYCIWGYDLREENLNSIGSINPNLWKDMLDILISSATKYSNDRSKLNTCAVSARINLGIGMESLFALLFACIQAHDCVPGWLQFYRTPDLISLISKVNCGEKILSKLALDEISWNTISDLIHCNFKLNDSVQEKKTKEFFGQTLSRFAHEMLDQGKRREFNSLKHSMRVQLGGFGVKFSLGEDTIDRNADEFDFGYSEYGASFVNAIQITKKSKSHYAFERVSHNWNIPYLLKSIEMIQVLTNNLKTYLLGINGYLENTPAKYMYPTELGGLDSAQFSGSNVINSTIRRDVREADIEILGKNKILSVYTKSLLNNSKL